MTKSRGILRPRAVWTDAAVAKLTIEYPNVRTEDIAAALGMTLGQVYGKASAMGLKKSAEFMATPSSGRTNGRQGIGTRFGKGSEPWNKGKSYNAGGRSPQTRFTPGQLPHNHKPVGSTRVSDGYVWIKTAEPKTYELLHRVNWRKEHGSLPPPGMALVFKDGNKLNCDVSNLELQTRAQVMQRNTRHNLPKELSDLIQLRGAITRQINRRTKNEQ